MVKINELKDFSRGQIDTSLMKIGQEAGMGTAESINDRLRGDLIIQPKSFPISKNDHGHYVFTIIGQNLPGEQEIARVEKGVSDYVHQILTSTNADGYDNNHRLEGGKEYIIVLVPGREIEGNRTTVNIQECARSFGYKVPLAGIIPRIRVAVSDKQMEQMDIWYIVGLHTPIKDADGDMCVLNASRGDDDQWLHASWGAPDYQWNCFGAFAFLASES
jgi:hypothetical protein